MSKDETIENVKYHDFHEQVSEVILKFRGMNEDLSLLTMKEIKLIKECIDDFNMMLLDEYDLKWRD